MIFICLLIVLFPLSPVPRRRSLISLSNSFFSLHKLRSMFFETASSSLSAAEALAEQPIGSDPAERFSSTNHLRKSCSQFNTAPSVNQLWLLLGIITYISFCKKRPTTDGFDGWSSIVFFFIQQPY